MTKRFKSNYKETQLEVRPVDTGLSIEEEMRVATEQKTPITSSSPMIYTAEKDGVHAECDIRTDRFDLALQAMKKADKSQRAKGWDISLAKKEEEKKNEKTEPENLIA